MKRKQQALASSSSSSSSNSHSNRYDLPTVSNDSEHQHITTQLLEQILLSSQDDNSGIFQQHSTFT
jgi:hypothetical protein